MYLLRIAKKGNPKKDTNKRVGDMLSQGWVGRGETEAVLRIQGMYGNSTMVIKWNGMEWNGLGYKEQNRHGWLEQHVSSIPKTDTHI